MGLFKLLLPIIDKLLNMASWNPIEDIKKNNQKLANELDEGKISVLVKATPEQIAEIQKLSNKKVYGKPYSPRGKYLTEQFGKEMVEAICKSEGQIKVAGTIPGEDDNVVSKPEMVKLRRQRKQQEND